MRNKIINIAYWILFGFVIPFTTNLKGISNLKELSLHVLAYWWFYAYFFILITPGLIILFKRREKIESNGLKVIFLPLLYYSFVVGVQFAFLFKILKVYLEK